jgi:hypothetical protein
MVNKKKTFNNVIIDYTWGGVNYKGEYGHILGTIVRGVAFFMA